MLTDNELQNLIEAGRIVIDPYNSELLRPVSYSLTLGSRFMRFQPSNQVVSVSCKESYPECELFSVADDGFIIEPGEFVLGGTVERLGLDRSVGATLRNLSGLSRIGIAAEIASLISPGFGEYSPRPLTLELRNFSNQRIRLLPGMRICHVVFFALQRNSDHGYDSSFGTHSLDEAPSSSRFYEDFKS